MQNQLKTLSETQLEHLIKKSIDEYLNTQFDYTVRNINTRNVGSEQDRLSFKVEIQSKERVKH